LFPAGIPELVAKLQSQGKNVFLVSGGFRQVIHPIAESLNIPVDNVHANNLLFKVSVAVPDMAFLLKVPARWEGSPALCICIPVGSVHANNLLFKVRRASPVTVKEGLQHIICHGVATTGGAAAAGPLHLCRLTQSGAVSWLADHEDAACSGGSTEYD
jgi:hypothetical protein